MQAQATERAAEGMQLAEVVESAIRTMSLLKMKVSSVTSVAKVDDGWRVTVELVERASVPDTMDLLGVYEIRMDAFASVKSYERTRVRRRSDLR